MALLDIAAGRSPIKGYNASQIVQRAAMMYPVKPLEMFAAARMGLAVDNSITVMSLDYFVSAEYIHADYSIDQIAKVFKVGDVRLRQLFDNFGLTQDTGISVFYGADDYSGLFLISVMRSSLHTTVTYVTTRTLDVSKLGLELKDVLLQKVVPADAVKA